MTQAPTDAQGEALAILPLPRIQLLSDAQTRGVTCVWCGIVCTAQNSLALGTRPRPDGTSWFPRGCHRCLQATARTVLPQHTARCRMCTPGGPGCDVRSTLRGLVRPGWK